MRKILSILLCAILVCSMIGCANTQNSKKSVNIVEIEGHEYDLSQDFEEVIDTMAKDGLIIVDMMKSTVYTEDGEWINVLKSNMDFDSINLYVASRNMPQGEHQLNVFEFDYGNTDFKTVDNMTYKSSVEDLKNLEGYTSGYNISQDREQSARFAFYEDGELIDLDKYRKMLKEIDIEDETELKKYMYEDYEYASYVRLGMMEIGIGEYVIFQSEMSDSIKLHECMLGLAAAEALYRLEQGEISSITEIRYSYAENPKIGDPGMWTRYKVITSAGDEKAE